jgi:hypothetical protein
VSYYVLRYLCGVREEQDPEDRVIDNPADVILASVSNRSDGLFRVDLFGRKVNGRTARNIDADKACDRIKAYNGVMQGARNRIVRLARGSEFGRGENRDRAEREKGDRREGTNVDDLSKVYVRNVIAEGGNRDGNQVQCGERVQGRNGGVLCFERRK